MANLQRCIELEGTNLYELKIIPQKMKLRSDSAEYYRQSF